MAQGIKIPRHIAIIMDGNRRWAKQRLQPTGFGHKKGAEVFSDIAKACGELGVEYLTVYAFSTENWRRSQEEVASLTNIIKSGVKDYLPKLAKSNMRLRVLGETERFDDETRAAIEKSEQASEKNTGLNVNICLSYGGRADITAAVNSIIKSGKASVTEQDITDALYTSGMPEPDLLIRTGGEVRISNFLLWQCAYSEFYFTELLWPDFDKKALVKAIEWYSGRSRRFGGSDKKEVKQ